MNWGNLRCVRDSLGAILLGGVGLWLVVTALFGSPRDKGEGKTRVTASATDAASTSRTASTSRRRLLTRPIESIRVGDRVLARNPDVSDETRGRFVDPDWRECSVARLELPLDRVPAAGGRGLLPGGDRDDQPVLQIQLLRPDDWFRRRLDVLAVDPSGRSPQAVRHAAVTRSATGNPPADFGTTPSADFGTVSSATPLRPLYREVAVTSGAVEGHGGRVAALLLDLDLPELGAAGTAIVTGLTPATATRPGPGRVVTGTFAHPPSVRVLDVRFAGETAAIGVTENHLFWSDDDDRFAPIGELGVGQTVRTVSGQKKRLVSKLPRPGPSQVYNLEVAGEHVYFVGDQGLLVHNSYVGDLGEKAARGWLKRHGYTGVTAIQNRSGHGLDIAARHRDGTLTFFEVKTSATARAPGLTRAQRDPERFVRTRLKRVVEGGKWWTSTAMPLQETAALMLREQSLLGSARYMRIEITNATDRVLPTIFKVMPW